MLTRTIEIRDNKALKLLKSLESIDFIKFKDSNIDEDRTKFLLGLKPKNNSKGDRFDDLKGIWKDRDITLEQIRAKAWPQRK